MTEIMFSLEKRKDKSTGELLTKNLPIKLNYSFDGKRFEYFTGLKIDLDKWDDGLERDKNGNLLGKKRLHKGMARRNTAESPKINKELNRLGSEFTNLYDTAIALKIPITLEYLRDGLKNSKNKGLNSGDKNIFDVFDEFIELNKVSLAENTIKKYTSTLNHLKKYCGNRRNISFYDVSLTFIEKFKNFLITKCGENEQGVTHNTVVKYMSTFIGFLRWSKKRGYNKNFEFEKYENEAEKEPAIIYLTWDELMHLYNLKIDNEYLAQVRDVFCFGCFTGQRYGDYKRLLHKHIINDIWVNVPEKGHLSQALYIPLNKYAKAIIKKYKGLSDGPVLPVISNQKMNEYLKELGELAELFDYVTIYKFKGSERVEKTYMKYEVLKTHTMRKTFVTNALALGMQSDMVKEFTGHKNDKDFNRYKVVLAESKIKAMDLFNKKK